MDLKTPKDHYVKLLKKLDSLMWIWLLLLRVLITYISDGPYTEVPEYFF